MDKRSHEYLRKNMFTLPYFLYNILDSVSYLDLDLVVM